MIDESFRPVVQSKTKSAAAGTAAETTFRPNVMGTPDDSRLQPARTRRSDRAVGSTILETSRKAAEQVRHRHETADPSWSNIAFRIQHLGNQAQMMQPRMQAHPVESLRARNHLDLDPGFLKQRCGFQCALSGPDDDYLLPFELPEIVVLARMRSQSRGNASKLVGRFANGLIPPATTTRRA